MANEPLKAAVVTDIGMAKLEAAYLAGGKVVISEMALGDSNLVYVKPNPSFTELVNEFGRQAINDGNTTESWINALVYVDSTQFANKSVLEFGLYDSDGDLIVYSSYTPSLVPDIGPNYIQLEIECSVNLYNASVVTLEVTPIYPQATELEMGIAKIVTEEQVDEGIDDSAFLTIKKFTRALMTTYSINTLIDRLWLSLASKIYPVGAPIPWPQDTPPDGYLIFKGQAFDVNIYVVLATIYPDGILPDMRGLAIVGKTDADEILAYEADGIKSHLHTASVTSADYGTKVTTSNGAYSPTIRGTSGESRSGSAYGDLQINSGQAHRSGYISAVPNHNHSVSIGSHGHSVSIAASGNTQNTIKNRKFNYIVRAA